LGAKGQLYMIYRKHLMEP